MATPPQLTPEQRANALAKAAEARVARAELKNQLKMGSVTLAEALASTSSTVKPGSTVKQCMSPVCASNMLRAE